MLLFNWTILAYVFAAFYFILCNCDEYCIMKDKSLLKWGAPADSFFLKHRQLLRENELLNTTSFYAYMDTQAKMTFVNGVSSSIRDLLECFLSDSMVSDFISFGYYIRLFSCWYGIIVGFMTNQDLILVETTDLCIQSRICPSFITHQFVQLT